MISEYVLKFVKYDPLYDAIMSIIYFSITYIITRITNYLLNKLKDKFSESESTVTHVSIILSIKEPLNAIIWIFCIYLTIKVTDRDIIFLKEIITILVAYISFWICLRFISQYTKRIVANKEKKGEAVDYAGVNFIKKLVQVTTFFIVSLICMARLGVNVQSIMTIGGVGGIAIGLGAQDLLANIFGTLSIYLNRPFKVGDWVCSPDRKIEGFVEEIGWRQTVIITFGRYPIYVANSVFNNIVIENKGRMRSRQIEEHIPIAFMDLDKIEKTTSEIREMLKNNSDINQNALIITYFESVLKPATLNLRMMAYTNAVDMDGYMKAKEKVLVKAIGIIKNNGGELAYDVARITVNENKKPNESIL